MENKIIELNWEKGPLEVPTIYQFIRYTVE